MARRRMTCLRLALCIFATMIVCIQGGNVEMTADAMDYLVKFNYLPQQNPRTGALRSAQQVEEAVKAFQRMAGIQETGAVDAKTMEMMNMPRCGMADVIGNGNRAKRYALQGSKWPKNDLTYRITTYTPDMSKSEVDSEIRRAFKVWSDYTPLTFTVKPTGSVDIEIIFAAGNHGDGNPFDGPSRVLAHAYFPQFGGDAHFDEAEQWTLRTRSGVNLFQVAAHEFGHSLGLSHSDVRQALMAPFYAGYQPDFKLHSDDIAGIQRLYGRKPATQSPETPPPPPTQPPTMKPTDNNTPCKDGKLDTILSTTDGMTYAFRGKYYYYLDPKKEFYFSEPMLISEGWKGLPNNIDAGFTHTTWKRTYFFKGDKYWRFGANRIMDRGYPKPISHWTGMPNDVDAVFEWSGNGKTYFVKGNQYWRYQGRKMDGTYPRRLSAWSGLPSTIDAAFQWPRNDRTYFYSGSNYYRYNDMTFKVDNGYPRSTAQWWFRCNSGEKLVEAPVEGEMSNVDGDVWVMAGVNKTSDSDSKSNKGFDDTNGSSHVTVGLLTIVSAVIGLLLTN